MLWFLAVALAGDYGDGELSSICMGHEDVNIGMWRARGASCIDMGYDQRDYYWEPCALMI